MDIIYKEKTAKIKTVEDRLKNLSLAFKLIDSKNDDPPSLADGKKSYIGYFKMNKYIDKLDREKDQWYYCDC